MLINDIFLTYNSVRCPLDNTMIELKELVPDVALQDVDGLTLLKYEEIEILKKIGEGAYGVIYEGFIPVRGEPVAIKTLDFTISPSEETNRRGFREFRHEVYLMSLWKHPNIVPIYGYSVNPFSIIMELIPYGTHSLSPLSLHSFTYS